MCLLFCIQPMSTSVLTVTYVEVEAVRENLIKVGLTHY